MAEYRRRADNNIYTVLAFIAFLALLAGVVYVLWRDSVIFQAGNPFSVPQTASAAMTMVRSLVAV